jgi:hypothetical protein
MVDDITMRKITRDMIVISYLKKVLPYVQQQENGCLLWSKASLSKPYGNIAITPWGINPPRMGAHKLSYLYHSAEKLTDTQLLVLHSCDTPACCNPKHLRLGTQAENVADIVSRGRFNERKGTANNNVKLTEKQVLQIYVAKGCNRGIADYFRVGYGRVGVIKNKRQWKHLTDAYDELMVG